MTSAPIQPRLVDPHELSVLLLEKKALEAENAALHAQLQLAAARRRETAVSAVSPDKACDASWTTLMLRNLPTGRDWNRDGLLLAIDSVGLQGSYDFLYAPVDFNTNRIQGFAFINFVSHSEAQRGSKALTGLLWGQSGRRCEVGWAQADMQGLEANVERYRSSPVMHESVADSHRPLLLSAGCQVPFPEPTKRVRAPRLRRTPANGWRR